MPQLDQYQSRVPLPRTVSGSPASPGIASQAQPIAALEGLANQLASASSIFARQEAQQAMLEQAEQAARDISEVQDALLQAKEARRATLGSSDKFGNPISPRSISQGYQEDARQIYDKAIAGSRERGPAYAKYFATQMDVLYKQHTNHFAEQMEGAQKEYFKVEFSLNMADLQRNAQGAETPGVRNFFLGQMKAQALAHGPEVGAEFAIKAFQEGEHNVRMSQASKYVRDNARQWIESGGATPEDFPIHPSNLTASDRLSLDSTARETLSTKRAIAETQRQDNERQVADIQLRTSNEMMGRLTDPDPTKRLSPALALRQLDSPQVQAQMGSHFHTVQQLALALQDKGRAIVTDQKVYTDILARIYKHEIVDPLDIIRERPSLDDGDFRHALSTLNDVLAKGDTIASDEFKRGTDYINGRLKAISIFGGPQNQELVTLVQGQFNRWYDEQRRRGTLRTQDVEGVARQFADAAWIGAGPPVLSELGKQREVLESGWKARQKSETPVTMREIDDYVNTRALLDAADLQLRLQESKKAGESGSSAPKKKPPTYRPTE